MQGKVKVAGLVGDKAIIKAIQNNSEDQTQAYEGVRLQLPPGFACSTPGRGENPTGQLLEGVRLCAELLSAWLPVQITKRDDLPKETTSLAASMLKDTKQQVAYFKSYLADH